VFAALRAAPGDSALPATTPALQRVLPALDRTATFAPFRNLDAFLAPIEWWNGADAVRRRLVAAREPAEIQASLDWHRFALHLSADLQSFGLADFLCAADRLQERAATNLETWLHHGVRSGDPALSEELEGWIRRLRTWRRAVPDARRLAAREFVLAHAGVYTMAGVAPFAQARSSWPDQLPALSPSSALEALNQLGAYDRQLAALLAEPEDRHAIDAYDCWRRGVEQAVPAAAWLLLHPDFAEVWRGAQSRIPTLELHFGLAAHFASHGRYPRNLEELEAARRGVDPSFAAPRGLGTYRLLPGEDDYELLPHPGCASTSSPRDAARDRGTGLAPPP
jgi:hypothetical protein